MTCKECGAKRDAEFEDGLQSLLASLPGCEHKTLLRHREIHGYGNTVYDPVWSDPCPNRATVRLKTMNIDLGWADQDSPGWLTCDEHEKGVDPKRGRDELPQAKLIRLLAAEVRKSSDGTSKDPP